MSAKKDVKETKLDKEKYNAIYLGWKQCNGLYGMEVISPILDDMINGPRPEDFKFDDLPRVVLGVSRKKLKVTQNITKKSGKTEIVKFHNIPMKELMFAARAAPPNHCVVGCIYLGLNPTTKGWTHAHAYLCENSLSAETLIRHLYQYINTTYHKDRLMRIEHDLVKKGHITSRPPRIDNSPVDEMGFPRQVGLETPVGEPVYGTSADLLRGSTGAGDYSIYGSSSAEGSVYGCATSIQGHQDKSDSDGYQKYLLPDSGPFRIPRASPAVDRSQEIKDHAQYGFNTSQQQSADPYSTHPTDNMYNQGPPSSTIYQNRPSNAPRRYPSVDNTMMNYQQPCATPSTTQLYQRPAHVQFTHSGPVGPGPEPTYRSHYELEAGPPDYDGANGPDVIESAVAAELRQKLGKKLILLPPKDYDTVKRTHGNLEGIDERRSQNERVVGRAPVNTRLNQFDWAGKQ